jgi:predicted histone-like DNA-binding protein
MAATYDLRENPNPKKDGQKQPLYPRIVSKGTIPSRELLEEISSGTTFNVGELEGALSALAERMSFHLKNGYNVELGNLGYFSAKLKARPVMEKYEIRSASVEFDNVNFRASAWFKKHTRGTVERSNRGFQASAQLSEEERRSLLEKYLDENTYITRKDYTFLTGLLKNNAMKDLKEFVNQGILVSSGRLNQMIFLRAPKK